jgi:uncharacterized repeat protein (TIGR03803 family)
MQNLLVDKSGNVYGTTYAGGTGFCAQAGFGCGTVFKLSRSGTERLVSFIGDDGLFPQRGSLVMDAAGSLYGTTGDGGGTSCPPFLGCGTVFKVDPSGVKTVIYRFTGTPDASTPQSGLVIDDSGNLYGMTYTGGSFNLGAVFRVTPQGQETVLHSFSGPPDGTSPLGDLAVDSAGNFYGTTQGGGTGTCLGGCGTITTVRLKVEQNQLIANID